MKRLASIFLKSIVLTVVFLQSLVISQTNPCAQLDSYKIVVLGSSTAAGAGVSNSDSAWVNRYRNYLESINPDNEVINLAVGGYNTYKIMPTGFAQPTNRPAPDTNKNITAALSYNPDAIIVNMPSNDVSAGYNYTEQMFNLDSIFQLSNQFGVPIWICTTQPRNFSDTNKLILQNKLKDSIQSIFSPFTIDFWTNLAEPNFTINPSFNSGDGVHLNDSAHALLNERVKAVDILNYLYTSPNFTDYSLYSILTNFPSECGDSTAQLKAIIANHGTLDSLDGVLTISVQNISTNAVNSQSVFFSPISSCELDTIDLFINTFDAGTYHVFASTTAVNDTSNFNDTLSFYTTTSGRPQPIILNDTLCEPGMGILALPAITGDSTFWYLSIADTIPFHFGNVFQSPILSTNQTWYVESVRGPLYYNSNLYTTQNANINFNGAMLNIMPHTDLFIDSIGLKILNTGIQSVDIFYKVGSYLGHENNPTSWTLLTNSTANVSDSLSLTYFDIPTFPVFADDTIGFYFQMTNSQDKLGYLSMSTPKTRTNNEISIFTGSGIGHNFTNSYYPRDLNCDFQYHFENSSYGTCTSGKFPANVYVSTEDITLANDTIIDISDSIALTVPGGIHDWTWSTGDIDSSITLLAANLGVGIHYISIDGFDSLGCPINDQVTIGVADLVGILSYENTSIQLFPNPTRGPLFSTMNAIEFVAIYDSFGKMVHKQYTFPVDLSTLSPGIYHVVVSDFIERFNFQIIKQ
jgi:lysophospholipase L1-like esterase